MLILKIHNKYKIYLELFKNVSVLVVKFYRTICFNRFNIAIDIFYVKSRNVSFKIGLYLKDIFESMNLNFIKRLLNRLFNLIVSLSL